MVIFFKEKNGSSITSFAFTFSLNTNIVSCSLLNPFLSKAEINLSLLVKYVSSTMIPIVSTLSSESFKR